MICLISIMNINNLDFDFLNLLSILQIICTERCSEEATTSIHNTDGRDDPNPAARCRHHRRRAV